MKQNKEYKDKLMKVILKKEANQIRFLNKNNWMMKMKKSYIY